MESRCPSQAHQEWAEQYQREATDLEIIHPYIKAVACHIETQAHKILSQMLYHQHGRDEVVFSGGRIDANRL